MYKNAHFFVWGGVPMTDLIEKYEWKKEFSIDFLKVENLHVCLEYWKIPQYLISLAGWESSFLLAHKISRNANPVPTWSHIWTEEELICLFSIMKSRDRLETGGTAALKYCKKSPSVLSFPLLTLQERHFIIRLREGKKINEWRP